MKRHLLYQGSVHFDTHIKTVSYDRPIVENIDILKRESALLKKKYPQNPFAGCFLMPAAVDAHVHFNEPGFEFREDFFTGTTSAAFGGVSTVIDMPCTSLPPVTSQKNFITKRHFIDSNAITDFALWGGITAKECNYKLYTTLKNLRDVGVVGVKTYLISGMKTFPAVTEEQLKMIGHYAAKLNMLVAVHAEDAFLIKSRRTTCQQLNKNTPRDYCSVRDVDAELLGIQQVIRAAKQSNAAFHVVHLSSRAGMEAIACAQKNGFSITTETCPQYLAFTQKDFERLGSVLKVAPSVKSSTDCRALWQGLNEGIISFVTSDHAGGIWEKEKNTGNVWTDHSGIPGTELMVSYIFSRGFLQKKISLECAIRICSTAPAKHYHLSGKGTLAVETDADFAIIDLFSPWKVDEQLLHSKNKYTPFNGEIFDCKIRATFCRGKQLTGSKRCCVSPGYGRFIARKK